MTDKVSAEIEIAAPPEHVWAVLADLASYPQWHPVFLGASGQLAEGSRLSLTSPSRFSQALPTVVSGSR